MGKITIAFCFVAVCLLATSPTLGECPAGSSARADGTCLNSRCPKGSSPIANGTCLPDWYHAPSSPSDETLNTGRSKPVTKLGVHPSTPSGEQVCPKGYKGTPPNCAPLVQDGKKIIFF